VDSAPLPASTSASARGQDAGSYMPPKSTWTTLWRTTAARSGAASSVDSLRLAQACVPVGKTYSHRRSSRSQASVTSVPASRSKCSRSHRSVVLMCMRAAA
jgi:hypothetical protein